MSRLHEAVIREKMKSDCFRYLSACFCQPRKDLWLQERLLSHLATNLSQTSPAAALFAAAMESAIDGYEEAELASEYAHLFLGPFETQVPPYGSIYLDGERRVMGDSTLEVIRFYEGMGLSKSGDCTDLPDHIAVELEFMSYLIYRETEALERSDFAAAAELIRKQQNFLDQFLGRWIRPFCEKVKQSTDNRFYAALADCTSTFVGGYQPGEVRDTLGEEWFLAG